MQIFGKGRDIRFHVSFQIDIDLTRRNRQEAHQLETQAVSELAGGRATRPANNEANLGALVPGVREP
jgi:hypothetical protein